MFLTLVSGHQLSTQRRLGHKSVGWMETDGIMKDHLKEDMNMLFSAFPNLSFRYHLT
jgi:hypothetical protein